MHVLRHACTQESSWRKCSGPGGAAASRFANELRGSRWRFTGIFTAAAHFPNYIGDVKSWQLLLFSTGGKK